MKTILLLRHAKSSWRDAELADFDRPLAKRGRLAAAAMASHLATLDVRPDQVLCSPARRTRETLDHLQGVLGGAAPVRFERALYLAEAPLLLRRLRGLADEVGTVLLIGHNPGVERLATMLAGRGGGIALQHLNEKFPTGALAMFAADIERWRALSPGEARLLAFIRPRDLQAA